MSNEADYTGLTQGGSPWNISHVVGKFPYWLSLKPVFNDHPSYVTIFLNVPLEGQIRQVW
jgi:hypothetical protein